MMKKKQLKMRLATVATIAASSVGITIISAFLVSNTNTTFLRHTTWSMCVTNHSTTSTAI